MATKEPTIREALIAFADAHGLRQDWHEPDGQGVTAKVYGKKLDNAFPGSFHDTGEYVVELRSPKGYVSVNLAHLLADYCEMARQLVKSEQHWTPWGTREQ